MDSYTARSKDLQRGPTNHSPGLVAKGTTRSDRTQGQFPLGRLALSQDNSWPRTDDLFANHSNRLGGRTGKAAPTPGASAIRWTIETDNVLAFYEKIYGLIPPTLPFESKAQLPEELFVRIPCKGMNAARQWVGKIAKSLSRTPPASIDSPGDDTQTTWLVIEIRKVSNRK